MEVPSYSLILLYPQRDWMEKILAPCCSSSSPSTDAPVSSWHSRESLPLTCVLTISSEIARDRGTSQRQPVKTTKGVCLGLFIKITDCEASNDICSWAIIRCEVPLISGIKQLLESSSQCCSPDRSISIYIHLYSPVYLKDLSCNV